jgi:cytidine deaminase
MTGPLIDAARDARTFAYARHSEFKVGAAVLINGKIFVGCNVEAVDYDVTHAEESAISAMCAGGYADIEMIVAIGAPRDVPNDQAKIVTPCGKCRQKIYEWILNKHGRLDIDVIVPDPVSGEPRLCSIRELLPLSFTL